MDNAQRARTKGVAQLKTEDARILDALKKASAEARRRATTDGVPFIGGKKKTWSVPKYSLMSPDMFIDRLRADAGRRIEESKTTGYFVRGLSHLELLFDLLPKRNGLAARIAATAPPCTITASLRTVAGSIVRRDDVALA